jgi:hypothetical protein
MIYFPSLNSLYIESNIVDIQFSIFNFYILANILLVVGMPRSCVGMLPWKEGGILIENPLASKANQ